MLFCYAITFTNMFLGGNVYNILWHMLRANVIMFILVFSWLEKNFLEFEVSLRRPYSDNIFYKKTLCGKSFL